MKNSILTSILFTFLLVSASAQEEQRAKVPQKPHLIINSSIGYQWFGNSAKVGSLELEVPVSEYQHVGVLFSRFFEKQTNSYDYNYNPPQLSGSYEVGMYGKYFLHGRFTGRKSGFYVGPDVRIGVRKYGVYQYSPQLPDGYQIVAEKFKTTKFLISWGVQWHFGKHTVFEISAPIGYEFVRYPDDALHNAGYYSDYFYNAMVLLPTVKLGAAF